MSTGFVWHEHFMWHNTGESMGPVGGKEFIEPVRHPENVEGKRRIKNLLDISGLTDKLQAVLPRAATAQELLAVHGADYVARIKLLSDNHGGEAASRFASTPIGPGGYEIACLSAGGAIAAVDAVIKGTVQNAYALVRPPGHHALPDEAMGFCLFANASIAGRYALDVGGLERIAYVDFDVHHGNGTQQIFYNEPRALTISIHQDNSFPPDSGAVEENGEAAGQGYNINIPLPPGSGSGAYRAAFERVVLPALRAFSPDLIIVPAGFDAGAHDPLGRMMLHSEAYRELTTMLLGVATKCCDGRLVMCHEGGYSPHSVPFYCLAVIEALSGHKTTVEDPFLAPMLAMSYHNLQSHQDAAISRAEVLVERLSALCANS
jgi:acetoin utilization deacetylase AcuC-like enzyme